MKCPNCGSTDLRVDARVICAFHDAGRVIRTDHPDALITPVEEGWRLNVGRVLTGGAG
jgi:hypothetical protein